jgi:hypothetical protein
MAVHAAAAVGHRAQLEDQHDAADAAGRALAATTRDELDGVAARLLKMEAALAVAAEAQAGMASDFTEHTSKHYAQVEEVSQSLKVLMAEQHASGVFKTMAEVPQGQSTQRDGLGELAGALAAQGGRLEEAEKRLAGLAEGERLALAGRVEEQRAELEHAAKLEILASECTPKKEFERWVEEHGDAVTDLARAATENVSALDAQLGARLAQLEAGLREHRALAAHVVHLDAPSRPDSCSIRNAAPVDEAEPAADDDGTRLEILEARLAAHELQQQEHAAAVAPMVKLALVDAAVAQLASSLSDMKAEHAAAANAFDRRLKQLDNQPASARHPKYADDPYTTPTHSGGAGAVQRPGLFNTPGGSPTERWFRAAEGAASDALALQLEALEARAVTHAELLTQHSERVGSLDAALTVVQALQDRSVKAVESSWSRTADSAAEAQDELAAFVSAARADLAASIAAAQSGLAEEHRAVSARVADLDAYAHALDEDFRGSFEQASSKSGAAFAAMVAELAAHSAQHNEVVASVAAQKRLNLAMAERLEVEEKATQLRVSVELERVEARVEAVETTLAAPNIAHLASTEPSAVPSSATTDGTTLGLELAGRVAIAVGGIVIHAAWYILRYEESLLKSLSGA